MDPSFPFERSREIGFVALVAGSFLAGVAIVGWAVSPIVPDGVAPTSRSIAFAAVPDAPVAPAPVDAEPDVEPIPDGTTPDGATPEEITPSGTPRDEVASRGPLTVGDGADHDGTVEGVPPDSLTRLFGALRDRHLTLPVEGIDRDRLYDSFDDPRSGGRVHHAIDIMAPRGTPIFAVEDGTIARLDDSQAGGGIVVYQYGSSRDFVYYYAHLEKWADGLQEGARVGRGQVLGYVGTTGNAPPDAPHLHFAITVADAEGRWWNGIPINPFGLF